MKIPPLPLWFRQLIKKIPGASKFYGLFNLLFRARYREDGLLTVHNTDFLNEPAFLDAYRQALHHGPGTALRWRAHVNQWAGFHAAKLEGEFVECGVNRGFLSRSVMAYVDFAKLTDKHFFLVDTYCGLVPEQVTSEDRAAYWNEYTECYDFVVEAFKKVPNVVVVKGVVPDILPSLNIEKVAYLSIDMNCTYPEVAALEFFWPKMVPGAPIILDDYGFIGHEAQKEGADEFAQSVGVKILSLPTGQGLIIKPST